MAKSGPEMRSTHVIFSLVEQPFYENVPEGVKIILQNFKKFLSIKSLAAERLVAARARAPACRLQKSDDCSRPPKMFAIRGCVYTTTTSGCSRHDCLCRRITSGCSRHGCLLLRY